MKIRPYIKGDETLIMDLDKRELPSRWNPRTIKNWQWKFTNQNPAGKSFVWVAENQGELIAHFAAVPYRLKVFDIEILGSHSIGSLVDKRYQNRGLIKFVGDRMFEDLVASKVLVTWGFPNHRAHEIQKVFLGYKDLILFNNWLIEGQKIKIQDVIGFKEIKEFDKSFDQFWEFCKNDYDILIKRNSNYLNWRYLQRPDQRYFPHALIENKELKGYVVLKIFQEVNLLRGHIVDIFAAKEDSLTLSKLINGALGFFKRHSVHEVTSWIWGNSLVEDIFIKKGFNRQGLKKPLILRINLDFKYNREIAENSHWYFAMGDSTEIF